MSFDPGSRNLRLAFCWPPSIGAGNNEVMSFDWALEGAKSCPSIGRRQHQVISFDWSRSATSYILRLWPFCLVAFFDWAWYLCKMQSAFLSPSIRSGVSEEAWGFVSYSCLLFISFEILNSNMAQGHAIIISGPG